MDRKKTKGPHLSELLTRDMGAGEDESLAACLLDSLNQFHIAPPHTHTARPEELVRNEEGIDGTATKK